MERRERYARQLTVCRNIATGRYLSNSAPMLKMSTMEHAAAMLTKANSTLFI